MNWIMIAAGLLGFSAIALGAYGDHGLRGSLDADTMRSFETAIRYQLFHAIALLAISVGTLSMQSKRLLWVGIVMLAGTIIFSGSIYASVIMDMPDATKAAPFGGITLMASWLILVWAGFNKPRVNASGAS